MDQHIRALAAVPENLTLAPSTHNGWLPTSYDSSSWVSYALFLPPRTLEHKGNKYTQTHIREYTQINTYKGVM